MQLYLSKNEQQIGPYSVNEIRERLKGNSLSLTDLCRQEGDETWMPLSQILEFSALGFLFDANNEPVKPAHEEARTVRNPSEGITALACQNCGANLDYNSGAEVAVCLFCGSSHIIRQSGEAIARLRDLEDSSLRVSCYTPVIRSDAARKIIIEAIKGEPAGYKATESLQTAEETAYFPVWRIDANVQCSWHGEYSERRSITKWRKVEKLRPGGGSYKVDEPYTATETIWHPRSGSHVFATKLYAPASAGFSFQQLDVIRGRLEGTGDSQGHPHSDRTFAVATPSIPQSRAWDEFGCSDDVDAKASRECEACIERLNSVRAVVSSKEFSLFYLPIAVISYQANGSDFRHFVNLVTGAYSGDIPLDDQTMRMECLQAARGHRSATILRWTARTFAFLQLVFLGLAYAMDRADIMTSYWYLWVLTLGASLVLSIKRTSPWHNFLWRRRAFLFRILAHPPADLKEAMHAGRDVAALRRKIGDLASNNALEHVDRARTLAAVEYPARVLLGVIGPQNNKVSNSPTGGPSGARKAIRLALIAVATAVAGILFILFLLIAGTFLMGR